jgi:hypothetical protein
MRRLKGNGGLLLWLCAVLCAIYLLGVGVAPGRFVPHRQQSIDRCHRLGPEYHYWDTRARCVRYVKGSK